LSTLRTSTLVVGNAFIAKLAACIGAAVTAVTFHAFPAGLTLRRALYTEAALLTFYRRTKGASQTDIAPGVILTAAILTNLLTGVGTAVTIATQALIAVLTELDTILTDPAAITAYIADYAYISAFLT